MFEGPYARLKVMTVALAISVGVAPAATAAISSSDARLLLTRSGFTPDDNTVAAFAASMPTREAAVANVTGALSFMPPAAIAWMNDPTRFPSEAAFEAWVHRLTPPSGDAARDFQNYLTNLDAQSQQFVDWWLENMRVTPSPLAERLIAFLQNHFVMAQDSGFYIWHLQKMFRTCGAYSGLSFTCLLQGAVRDPAILLYLSQNGSSAKAPAQNMARELMEMYTVGVGHYTEADVVEVARALTGLTVGPDGMFVYDARLHDDGVKTVMGFTGPWGPSDIVRILLRQPSLAEHIVSELWMEFVSATPDPAIVSQIAAAMSADPEQKLVPVVQKLLLTDAFWNPANRGSLVKSPTEFVVGIERQLDIRANADDARNAVNGIGEHMWAPPNVHGFQTGVNWINFGTLVGRQGVAHSVANLWRAEVMAPRYGYKLPKMTPAQFTSWATQHAGDSLVLAPPSAPIDLASAAALLFSDPAYWLK